METTSNNRPGLSSMKTPEFMFLKPKGNKLKIEAPKK